MDLLGKVKVREKGPADLVTEADLASQEVVRQTVFEAFPDHQLVGEEDRPEVKEGNRGIPLDRRPFRRDHELRPWRPALLRLAGFRTARRVVGRRPVYDPTLNECFTAIQGQGAWLNGAPIDVSQITILAHALVAVGFPNVVRHDTPDLLLFNKTVTECQATRRTGSAALNLAYVAAGRFDVACSHVSHAWDFAAGALLVREAGGIITRMDGTSLVPEQGLLWQPPPPPSIRGCCTWRSSRTPLVRNSGCQAVAAIARFYCFKKRHFGVDWRDNILPAAK